MPRETADIFERLATLEEKERQSEKRIADLEIIVSYYNKLALKWGGGCIFVLSVGAMAGGHFDKIKEKLITWLLQ